VSGEVLALQVDGTVSQGPRQGHGYRNTERLDKLEGDEELGYGAYPVQLRMLRLYPKLEGTLSPMQGSLWLLPTFLDKKVRSFRD
jgi:hypothetical protein